MKKGWISIIVIVILVGVVFYFNQSNSDTAQGRDEKPNVGFLAPAFTLEDEQGNGITLSDLKGKPVFLNFWASWCPPCKEEMPLIQEAYELYGDKIEFIGINLTFNDSKNEAINFMKSNGYQMPLVFDYNGSIAQLYRADSIPTSFFIDKDGVIKVRKKGAMISKAEMESYIEKIMEE